MNPCVKNVTSRYVEFTPEFKQKIYDELIGGARIRDILLRHGIDPNVLGEARIRGLQQKIEKQAGRPDGFQNLRRSGQQPATSRAKTLEKQVRELQHQLAYTQQEVEFLKKIRMADLEAQKQWESKHRQK
jgi:transposase-like protein